MSYTADDIKILEREYDGRVLAIKFQVISTGSVTSRVLPNTGLMEALHQSGQIIEYVPSASLVRKTFNHPQLSLDYYMGQNLGNEMAEKLVLHYLNNKPVKP